MRNLKKICKIEKKGKSSKTAKIEKMQNFKLGQFGQKCQKDREIIEYQQAKVLQKSEVNAYLRSMETFHNTKLHIAGDSKLRSFLGAVGTWMN